MSLPIITQTSVGKTHDFYEKLITHSPALDTMGKLKEINGYIRLKLVKLPIICEDLVWRDHYWKEWDFCQFIETLRKWTHRNLISLEGKLKLSSTKRERPYQTNQDNWNPKPCVYCNMEDLKSSNDKTITKVEDLKKILSARKWYVLTAPEWNIEQLSVTIKEPVKHIKVNIIHHFLDSQVQWW